MLFNIVIIFNRNKNFKKLNVANCQENFLIKLRSESYLFNSVRYLYVNRNPEIFTVAIPERIFRRVVLF